MAFWSDSRHPMERDADARIAAARARDAARPAVPADSRPAETDITTAIWHSANRIAAQRAGIAEGKRMSLLGKMKHLTETAQDFHKETEAVLDGIASKIDVAKQKRGEAAAKHHDYYDTIIKGVDDSTEVIDRLSNGPLHGDGEG